jgi:hypothetical protein
LKLEDERWKGLSPCGIAKENTAGSVFTVSGLPKYVIRNIAISGNLR